MHEHSRMHTLFYHTRTPSFLFRAQSLILLSLQERSAEEVAGGGCGARAGGGAARRRRARRGGGAALGGLAARWCHQAASRT